MRTLAVAMYEDCITRVRDRVRDNEEALSKVDLCSIHPDVISAIDRQFPGVYNLAERQMEAIEERYRPTLLAWDRAVADWRDLREGRLEGSSFGTSIEHVLSYQFERQTALSWHDLAGEVDGIRARPSVGGVAT